MLSMILFALAGIVKFPMRIQGTSANPHQFHETWVSLWHHCADGQVGDGVMVPGKTKAACNRCGEEYCAECDTDLHPSRLAVMQ